MEVVESMEEKKGGLTAIVQGTIKEVILFAEHITCRTEVASSPLPSQ